MADTPLLLFLHQPALPLVIIFQQTLPSHYTNIDKLRFCQPRETHRYETNWLHIDLICICQLLLFFSCSAGLSSPLQILAAQASSSPPVLVSRQPPAGAETHPEQPDEPQSKRLKIDEDAGTESAHHQVTPAQQPVIVAMTSQTHDPRK